MLLSGRIYVALGPWHFGDFRKIFLTNIEEKKVLPSEREALALCHRINPTLVVALRL